MSGHVAVSAAAWQTGTAVVQAVSSIVLLGWYVLAAHLERRRARLERVEDFESLVRLCRDLGLEARAKTIAHLEAVSALEATRAVEARERLASWRGDMAVIYVCLNEVPHYEVRNPAFSTALTRLWLKVDARNVAPDHVAGPQELAALLQVKLDGICLEVDAMGDLLTGRRCPGGRAIAGAKRRGYRYSAEGYPEDGPGG